MEVDGADVEQRSFEAVFRSTYPRARGVALRILGSVPEAEDAAAEAFTRALVRWARVGNLPYLEAWLLRVTANVAVDVARRRRGRPAVEGVGDGDDDAVVLRLTLVAALAALPKRQREAVVLRHLAGLPEAEVAAALGVSANTAKKHVQRGMAALRSRLGSDREVFLALD